MLILAVDTTTPAGSTALLDGERLLAEFGHENQGTHSVRLMRSVDFVLDSVGLKAKDVEAWAAAAGPGSFTGIRIGLGTVKALAFASGRPAVGVHTLEALAEKAVLPGVRLLCPLLDAKKGEIYAALYERGGVGTAEIIAAGAYDPAAFFSRLPGGGPISFVGSGLTAYSDKLAEVIGDRGVFQVRSPFLAAEIGRLAGRRLASGRAAGLEPIYLRRSQAEEKCPR